MRLSFTTQERLCWFVLAACHAMVCCSFAQLPVARLTTIFPPGGKIGTTFEVTVAGQDLDDAARLHFSHAGITSAPAKDANKFNVTIASNVPPGIYEARVAGRFGVSNPRAFAVGHLKESIKAAGNATVDLATEVAVGTTVNGRATANTVDHLKFTAKQGQRILVDCQAREIDSRLDPVLVLLDTNGRELAHDRRGELLDFTAPADGPYLLRVFDFTYSGGDEYFYRLSVHAGPHIDFIFPPSGRPGTKSKYTLFGRNLPGSTPTKDLMIEGRPLEQLTVEIELPADPSAKQRFNVPISPAGAVLDGIEYRLNAPQDPSNPVLLSFATAPVVAEAEPNDKPANAQKISLPCELVGQLYPGGDQDWVTFDAKKGDAYWVEVFSHRLGLPTSPFVLIQRVSKNDKGEEEAADVQEVYESDTNIGGNEFNTRHRDPAARFDVKQDGAYRVQVRDLFNRTQSSPDHVYRLSLRKEAPDFRLVALPQAAPLAKKDAKDVRVGTSFLRRGETIPVKVLAFRRDGFNGEIQLSAEGLPSGVSAGASKVEAGKTSAFVMLTASEDAAAWIGPLKIVGKAKVGDTELSREARGGTLTWNVPDPANEVVQSRVMRDVILAVSGSEPMFVTVRAAENKVWEAPAEGKLTIPLDVTRRGDFNANLSLKPAGVAALEGAKEFTVDSKTNTAMLEVDLKQQKLSPGMHTFYLQGQTQGKYRKDYVALTTAQREAKEAEKMAMDLAVAAKKAADEAERAAKEAKEVEAAAKVAEEKMSTARTAADKTPDDEELADACVAAEKAASDATTRARVAAEVKAAAEKAANEASTKAKDAEKKKEDTAKYAKELEVKEKPKDVTVTVYSAPITVKIAETAKKK